MNKIQQAAYSLIQSDAKFLYTLTQIGKHIKSHSNNYITMSLPYIGVFAHGAEQWGRKTGLNVPKFTNEEKEYYNYIRSCHKIFEKNFFDYSNLLRSKLSESDRYFYSIRSLLEKKIGYFNVGTDLCNGEYSGNTILCSMYIPINTLENKNAGPWIKGMSVVAGKLSATYMGNDLQSYLCDRRVDLNHKDYHFYNNSPLKMNNELGFVLFSILCSINYAIEFVDKILIDETPQKFKFAYLQYYYLCNFINELNIQNGVAFNIDTHLYNKELRNCLAHYGLGQFFSESDVIEDDILKGLTLKAFGADYNTTKAELYLILRNLTFQIKNLILK